MAFFRRAAEKAEAKKVLRVGVLSPVKSLDPRDAQDSVSVSFLTQAFEGPYLPPNDADTPPRPLLFDGPLRREEPQGDRPVFSGRLRAAVKFSDGTALTAAHVAASLMRAVGFVTQAEARADGDRVVFVLKRPNPRFALLLSNHFCSIALDSGNERLGTGPYTIVGQQGQDEMRLVKNPHYRGVVAIDEIVFKNYPTGADGNHDALIQALESGEVHFTTALSRDDVGKLQHARKYFQTGISTCSLYVNTEHPHLQDARVRRALAMAIDRAEITRLSYENALAFTATSLLPPLMGSFRDGIRTSPEQGRDLLREATGGALPRLKLLMPWGPRAYVPHPAITAEAITRQLARVGVEVEQITSRDSQDFYRLACAAEYDLALIGWIADSIDPAEFLEVNLHSLAMPQSGKSPAVRHNLGRWNDPEMDALLERYRRDGRDDSKQAILQRVADQVPLLPLMYGPRIVACSWELTGFTPSVIGHTRFGELDLERKA
jgi:ABC-type transport system substrate-binding protein